MLHSVDLIITLATCLSVALLFGFLAQKLKMSAIVGYLIAGIILGPFSPGFVANSQLASEFAEIGVILLMFGVGLHFHLKDLIAVKNVAIPGALVQIAFATLAGTVAMHLFGYSVQSGIVFGIAISVASTVVLMRVLTDNRALHTPIGHTAIGWLVVEDLFTILVLVLLPAVFGGGETNSLFVTLGITVLKLILLTAFTLVLGQKVLPLILSYVAKTGTRDLFTLAVLVLALGIAVGASEFFGASMALGAFLAGMVIGQSDFSARAASEVLPMRDAFAVLFFVSVGMLFNPYAVFDNWKLIAVTLFIVMIIKPLTAIGVVLLLKQPLKNALSVGVALAQVGEFSFIVVSLGVTLGIFNNNIYNAVIVAAIVSITLNSLIYKLIDRALKFLRKYRIYRKKASDINTVKLPENGENCTIIVGYGPIGRKIVPILLNNGTTVVVIEMNIDTVHEIHINNEKDLYAIYGDASQKEVLLSAGIECAQAIVISSSTAPASEIVEVVRSLNPHIRILIHTAYLREADLLKSNGADVVFSGEGEVARSLSSFILKELGSSDEDIVWECRKIYESDEA